MGIEAQILIGLLAMAFISLAIAIPLKIMEYYGQSKRTSAGIGAFIYLIFYVGIIWYWFNLLSEVI